MRWLDGITKLNRREFVQVPGDGEGQGSLACCSPWGRKESDTTEKLNNTLILKVKVSLSVVSDFLHPHRL